MFKKSKNLGKGRTNNPNQCLNKCKVTTKIFSVDFLDNCVHGYNSPEQERMCWIQLLEEEVSAAAEGWQDGQEEGIHGWQMCLDISDIM